MIHLTSVWVCKCVRISLCIWVFMRLYQCVCKNVCLCVCVYACVLWCQFALALYPLLNSLLECMLVRESVTAVFFKWAIWVTLLLLWQQGLLIQITSAKFHATMPIRALNVFHLVYAIVPSTSFVLSLLCWWVHYAPSQLERDTSDYIKWHRNNWILYLAKFEPLNRSNITVVVLFIVL